MAVAIVISVPLVAIVGIAIVVAMVVAVIAAIMATTAIVIVTTVVTAMIVPAMVIAAVVVTALAVVVTRDLLDAIGYLGCKILGGKGRCAREQRGNKNKGHWACHFCLLSGSKSIRCGASIVRCT
jgi:hypothetical protein